MSGSARFVALIVTFLVFGSVHMGWMSWLSEYRLQINLIDGGYMFVPMQRMYKTGESKAEMDFGIILLAYSEDKNVTLRYITEAQQLCRSLLSMHANESYDLKISLFTVESHYMDYAKQYTSCEWDQVIYTNQLRVNNKSAIIGANPSHGRWVKEFGSRIKILSHSPYYVTMSLDSDLHPCLPLNVKKLYHEMKTKHIDFAFASLRHNFDAFTGFVHSPQGGLFLYQKTNNTHYLLDEWYKLHNESGRNNDQTSLRHTIENIMDAGNMHNISIYSLNNRYNYKGFGENYQKNHYPGQLLYRNNPIVMFHDRTVGDEVCDTLNKYTSNLSAVYFDPKDKDFHHCFSDKECSRHVSHKKPVGEEERKQAKFLFSNEHNCQWNKNVDLVPFHQDMC